MADLDAPEITLCRTIAGMLHAAELGIYQATGAYSKTEHGIIIDGDLPTTIDNCTVIIPETPLADGSSDMLYRVQLLTRIKGRLPVVRARAHRIFELFDHREYTPNILGISWTEEYSRLYFTADTQGRGMVAQNFQFRGRRQ
ncbi:hypothetical protein MN032_17840 [Agromyces atrinae]|uniref:hypothetical protein n=1 Tax=Agromyces atrinae TaxID=592376 RepID=UPI001F594E99|nr:hypothetical protein [Agromyces atrinae]MCI2959550.1 hypothetical protein [Agromyces atrinae]